MAQRSAIIIGAGIVGLATARALAVRGYKVTVIERSGKAVGASIRNFGMVWPIGQPDGALYNRAMLSKKIWKEVADHAGIWYDEVGSLHLAYQKDEKKVLEELQDVYRHRNYTILSADETMKLSPAVIEKGLAGSLYSPDEMIVDPRKAIHAIPAWLTEAFGVEFVWNKAVTSISHPSVYAGKEVFNADEIFVCSGADFETLYPEVYSSLAITKCKLQMMRLTAQLDEWRIGPALCGGLSLLHYTGFKAAASLNILRKRLEHEYPEYIKAGIHVMVSQNQAGELTIGDSHEYGITPEPFDSNHINDLILDYLDGFARFKNNLVIETWNGIYAKLTDGQTHIITKPHNGVTIINGMGGAGMTLSFGLCEELIAGNLQ